MAELLVHYDDGNGRTTCLISVTLVKTTKKWSKVTCKNCKQVSNSGWNTMS